MRTAESSTFSSSQSGSLCREAIPSQRDPIESVHCLLIRAECFFFVAHIVIIFLPRLTKMEERKGMSLQSGENILWLTSVAVNDGGRLSRPFCFRNIEETYGHHWGPCHKFLVGNWGKGRFPFSLVKGSVKISMMITVVAGLDDEARRQTGRMQISIDQILKQLSKICGALSSHFSF